MFRFESLADVTTFSAVRRLLCGQEAAFSRILFVREERLLACVAELISADRPTDGDRSQFARWIREGQVAVGWQRVSPSDDSRPDGCVEIDSIHGAARCRILQLPPFCLVHLLAPPNLTTTGFPEPW